MSADGFVDSDGTDHEILISPRRRTGAGVGGTRPADSPTEHYDDLTSSLYSFTYSQSTGSLLSTRLSALQRNVASADMGAPAPPLPNILLLLQFLRQKPLSSSLPVASVSATAIGEFETASGGLRDGSTTTPGVGAATMAPEMILSTQPTISTDIDGAHNRSSDHPESEETLLRFLTVPYLDTVNSGAREPSASSKRPPSMFRRASSMFFTSLSPALQGISTPLEHLPSKNVCTQAVLTTEAVHPFRIRTLNDIACLVCVTNQQTAPGRSILDFVAPQFLNFLTSKISEQPAARVRLSGELVDFLIMSEAKLVSLWVENVSAETLVWTLQEVSVCKSSGAPIPEPTRQPHLQDSEAIMGTREEPVMRHSINEQHFIVLASPLGLREPTTIGCAVALDFSTHVIRGYNRPTMYFLLGYRGEELIGKHVSEILPQFPIFWEEIRSLCTSVGIVIPEHKFRTLAGIDVSTPEFLSPDPSRDPERSIRANAKFGAHTFVDIQLRLVDPTTLVLWISYSRNSAQADLEKQMLHVPSQRTLLPTVLSLLSPTPSTSSQSSEVSSEEVQATFKEKATPVAKDTNGLPSPSSIETDFRADQEPALRVSVTKSAAQHNNEGRRTSAARAAEPRLDEPSNTTTDTNDDQVWEELSKIQVGSERRTKSLQDFDVLKVLGEGAYGRVSLVRHKGKNLILALKSVYKDRILVDTWSRDRKLGTIPNEIRILNQLRATRHPHIVDMVDFFEDPQCYHMEMLPIGSPQGVDLFDFLEAHSAHTSQRTLLNIWGQAVSAVAHVHSLGIVHRDIKDENIVMDQRGNAKLIDFGSAAYLKQGPFDVFVGTVDYAAPEVVQGQTYEGCPQDNWALGILLYTIMFKETPFHGIEAIIEGTLPAELDCLGSPLIRRLLVRNPGSRPTAARCLEYLKDMEIS